MGAGFRRKPSTARWCRKARSRQESRPETPTCHKNPAGCPSRLALSLAALERNPARAPRRRALCLLRHSHRTASPLRRRRATQTRNDRRVVAQMSIVAHDLSGSLSRLQKSLRFAAQYVDSRMARRNDHRRFGTSRSECWRLRHSVDFGPCQCIALRMKKTAQCQKDRPRLSRMHR